MERELKVNSLITITTINDEPRVLDIHLAEALGMATPRFIRANLIEPNREELEGFGILISENSNSGKRGRPALPTT